MSSSNKLAIGLIISLFFLWGLAHNMNPILIPHLKRACQLSDLQSAFIDSAFYIGYFAMALPAGFVMRKIGYKGGILVGLFLFAFGAFMFYPAAEVREYSIFLAALFIIASGLTFLETAANPYITILGDPSTSVQRLNFAQSFNGLAATIAPAIGSMFILSKDPLSEEAIRKLPNAELKAYLDTEAATVQTPYLVIGAVVLLVALIIARTKLPDIIEADEKVDVAKSSIWKEKNLMLSVVAQFFYVGAQVCVGSFFIRFSGFVADIREQDAGYFLSVALLGFMIGRFFGTFLMKFIEPARLLLLYGVINILLLLVAINTGGVFAVCCLVGVEFFMSIMFPTIFSMGIRGLGSRTKQGSSLLIMSIVGGAVLPVIMGRVSDVSNIQLSYIVPCLCFIFIVYFAWKQPKGVKVQVSGAH